MVLTDDDHEAARIIKELEQRVADLEEQSRSTPKPNFLITEREQIGVGDRIGEVTVHELTTAMWDDEEGGGWDTGTWSDYDRA